MGTGVRDVLAGGGGTTSGHKAVRSDTGLTPFDQSVAGAAAKVLTKFVLFPLDTWKSRLQAWPHTRELGNAAELWTVRGMYRGFAPKLVLYVPYQAMYMAVYVQVRDVLLERSGSAVTAFLVGGVAAELAASSVRLPMEVSKVRLQLGIYRSSWHALQAFLSKPLHFYGHFLPQTVCHDCVYSALHWVFFETCRQRLFASRDTNELPAHENLFFGFVAGAATAWLTTPLDVLKVRILMGAPRRGSLGATARTLWQEGGLRFFWRGAALRVAHLAPSQGLYMFLYEWTKHQISSLRDRN